MNSKDIKVIPCTVAELLPMFCCNPALVGKYSIADPWVYDGWKYAADGSVCIRVKTDEADTDSKSRLLPAAYKQFTYTATKWLQWPKYRQGYFQPVRCRPCRRLAGRNAMCGMCRGKRWHLVSDKLVIARRDISVDYWWLIGCLPNVLYAAEGESLDPLHFRFGIAQAAVVGEGVVMPLRD